LRLGGVSDVLRTPVPRQKFVNALGGVIWQANQHVSEPSLWIDVVELGGGDEGVDGCGAAAALDKRRKLKDAWANYCELKNAGKIVEISKRRRSGERE
jgi:hypothetical protein